MSFGGFQMPVVCMTFVLCNSLSPVLLSASFMVACLKITDVYTFVSFDMGKRVEE